MTQSAFPVNVQVALAEFLAVLPGVTLVVKRPLRPSDANGAVGVSAIDWVPLSAEIGHFDPAVAKYTFKIEALVKNVQPEQGLADGGQLAKLIRTMLYRDPNLRIRLGQLEETSSGITERTQRWGVTKQQFASNDVKREFLHLSTTPVWVETETN